MTEKQDPPEYVTVYRTAQEMLQSAKAWHPDARLMGNVRAGDIAAVCQFLIRSMEASYPIIHLSGLEFLWWSCSRDCRGGVLWENKVAVCQTCGESSQSRASDAGNACCSDLDTGGSAGTISLPSAWKTDSDRTPE